MKRYGLLAAWCFLICPAALWAQAAPPDPTMPKRIWLTQDSLSKNANNLVLVEGVAGALIADAATSTVVYRLSDDYNNAVRVRCPRNQQPALYHRYRIVGTVIKVSDDTYEISEQTDQRTLAPTKTRDTKPKTEEPPPVRSDKDKSKDKDKDKESTDKPKDSSDEDKSSDDSSDSDKKWKTRLLIIGGGLIAMALLLLVIMATQQSSARAREAAIRERMAAAPPPAAAPLTPPTPPVPITPPVGPSSRPPTVLDETERAAGHGAAQTKVPAGRAAAGTGAAPAAAGGPGTVMALGRLDCKQGPHLGQTFPISSWVTVIGRTEGDVRLAQDETVSGRHGTVVYQPDGSITFRDEGRNGSRVNGQPLQQSQIEIHSGDRIELGLSLLEFTNFRQTGPGPEARVTTAVDAEQPAAAPPPAAPPSEAPTIIGPTPVVDPRRAPTMMSLGAQLEVVSGKDQGLTYALAKLVTKLGRMDDQDLQLTDPAVSRAHGELAFSDGQFTYRNLSGSGTKVNGARVQEVPLNDGDQLELGQTIVRFTRVGG